MTFSVSRGGISDHGGLAGLIDYSDHPGLAIVGSGTYTGNSAQNRSIAHGLGVVPVHVITLRQDGVIFIHRSAQQKLENGSAAYYEVVTVWDSTSFYVGSVSVFRGNLTGYTYKWVAFG